MERARLLQCLSKLKANEAMNWHLGTLFLSCLLAVGALAVEISNTHSCTCAILINYCNTSLVFI
jgi:hypothetical protein